MLVVEELAADAVFVVHVQELAFLVFDFVEDASAAVDLLLGDLGALVEVVGDRLPDFLAFGVGDGDTAVVLLDGALHDVDGLVALGALVALVVGADEVLVGSAVAFVLGVDQAAATGAAADRALEVVLVCTVALAGMVVGFEDGLDAVEELLADERLVPAWVALAAVGDDPGVVGA
ncbi:MAG TPA: hypothetical protein VG147_09215 [Solirubrobacteraceae bacterium]|nr:hypothetical protein [Solirubrobacteraceae bacterium]